MEESTSNHYTWDLPQRQSPAAVFIMLWSTVLKLLKGFWPVLVLYVFKKQSNENTFSILGIVAIFGGLSIVATIINYWFKKFYIADDQLIVKSGWLRKKTVSIPFKNIQAIHLEQNVWQQALKVAKVSFDATGSEKVEVQLDALAIDKAAALKSMLVEKKKDTVTPDVSFVPPSEVRYFLGFADLIKLSLTANHLEAFLILFAVGFNILEEIKDIFEIDSKDFFNTYAQEVMSQTAFMTTFLFLGVAFASILFSSVRTVIKFYGFQLTDSGKDWKVVFGLFNREQKAIPVSKIQILSWNASWLRRKFDYWVMRVQAVGQNKKQHVRIPVIAASQLQALSNSYQKFEGIDTETSYRISPAYWKRKVLLYSLPFTVISILLGWIWIGWWSMLFIPLFMYITSHFYLYHKNFRWQVVGDGLQIQSGAWGRKFTLLNWKKVQQVHFHQSPYQKRKDLTNIVFITAGGRVVLPYLKLSSAQQLANYVLFFVESKNEPWM